MSVAKSSGKLSRMRAWFEIMRVSNAPTVLSNAIAGAALGELTVIAVATGPRNLIADGFILRTDPSVWDARIASIVVGLLAYIGGMMLNDAFDAAIDARERPMRAIPSGRVAQSHAFVAGFACLLAALIAAWLTASTLALAATLVLVGAVLTYNALHALTSASVVLLALCRALACVIPMFAYAGDDWKLCVTNGALALPVVLAAWTLGLSVMARGEVAGETDRKIVKRRGNASHIMILLAPFTVALALVFVSQNGALNPNAYLISNELRTMLRSALPFGIAVMIVTTTLRARMNVERDPRTTPSAVALWISCLALIDAMAMFALGQFVLGTLCGGLCLLTRKLQRSIAGS